MDGEETVVVLGAGASRGVNYQLCRIRWATYSTVAARTRSICALFVGFRLFCMV